MVKKAVIKVPVALGFCCLTCGIERTFWHKGFWDNPTRVEPEIKTIQHLCDRRMYFCDCELENTAKQEVVIRWREGTL
jgi:hypothetical protein